MDRGGVGDKRGSKEMDGCPLTDILSTDQSPSMSEETNEMEDVPYKRGIGLLMYAATSTHPDIAFPVAILSQFMRNPGRIHWEAVKT
jgi:hypothetical protein